jgi:hypothetical protein
MESSDVDLIIIRQTKDRWVNRIVQATQAVPQEHLGRYRFDFLVYTESEFEEMQKERSFVRQIANEGKLLYERKK